MTRASAPRRGLSGIFGIPLALALLSFGGLICGLLGDGIWDVLSCIAVGLPPALAAWYALKPARRDARSSTPA